MRAKWTIVTLVLLLAGAEARGSQILYVDDDGMDPFNCAGAPFQTITDALAVANAGDEIRVCPGVYPEQVTITKSVTIRGENFGSRRAVIKPAALPATLPSLWSTNPITAAVLVDTKFIRMSDVDIDLSDNTLAACSPALAGLYLRNTSGRIERVEVYDTRLASRPDCESGVGVFIESGPTEFVLGKPINGTARVSLRGVKFENYQKAGLAAHGPRTILVIVDASATAGVGPVGGAVANGYEFAFGARGKLVDSTAEGHTTAVPGRLAAGVLGFELGKTKIRRDTFTDNQVGVFVVGDRARIKRSVITDNTSDGVVLLGDANLVASTEISRSSVSGCFVNGDRNVIRGGFINDAEFGVWFIAGFGNAYYGTTFQGVDLATRGVFGGVRDLTPATAAPFRTRCTSSLACDDGDACTTDPCDVMSGVCSHAPVVCDDANPCTDDSCDSLLGCQNVVDDTNPCSDGSVCTTADVCSGGVCAGVLTPPAVLCNAGNGTVCDGLEACNPVTGTCDPGTPPTCDDGNECTTDTCDAILGCQVANVIDGTPCTGGTCTGGVCL